MKARLRRTLPVAVIVGVLLFLAITGDGQAAPAVDALGDELAEADGVPGGGLLLVLALAGMIFLGSPLFFIIGMLAMLCYGLFGEGFGQTVEVFPAVIGNLTKANVLLAIPFFVVSGAIMSAGDIANRIIAFTRALVSFLPGGLAIATVGGCVFFAAISGSSPVTVIAIGAIMYPALVKEDYEEKFSLGLVTTAGSLGILIPPSIPMIIFAIAASGRRPLDVGELFMAGILPGLLIGVLLSAYSAVGAMKQGLPREPFEATQVWARFKEGFWAVMLPVLILGGIYTGIFTPTEAAAMSVVYALVVELLIHREIGPRDIPGVLAESAVLMGVLLIIMGMAFGLNHFLVDEKIADRAVAWIQSMDLSVLGFLLIVNLFLLVVGALMDSISAILIIAPLLTPIAAGLGIDPVHLGVVFIVNLEIGYLTPPIGINLFVASTVFEKTMGHVIKSVVPFILLMLVGLGIVTYVPTVAMGPVNVFLRDKPFYEPLPEGPQKAVAADVGSGVPQEPGDEPAGPEKVLSVEEMMKIAESLEDTDGAGGSGDDTDGEFAGGKVLSIEEMMQVAGAMDTDGGSGSSGGE